MPNPSRAWQRDGKVEIKSYVTPEVREKLRELCEANDRSVVKMLIILIEREHARRFKNRGTSA